MAKTTSIRVNERKTAGKGAARAERRAGLIPGVIYGEKKEPVMFSISALDLDAQMRQKGFWTRQFEIEVGKNKYHAICQDSQFLHRKYLVSLMLLFWCCRPSK